MFRSRQVLPVLLLSTIPFLAAASKDCPDQAPSNAKLRMAQLSAVLRFHDDLYYGRLSPVISDDHYDRLFAELVQLEECFPALAAADSPTRSVAADATPELPSLRHAPPMLSLASSTDFEAIESLWQKIAAKEQQPRLLVQPKVDGLPVELIYRAGRLVSAATRGDGHMGADVTGRVGEIPGIPLRLSGDFPERLAVRGEIYADRGLMAQALAGGVRSYATPRHFAAATLKSHQPEPLALAALRLFPFELVHAEELSATSDLAALGQLSRWGFPVRLDLSREVRSLEEIGVYYQKQLLERDRQTFAADGIVVKADAFALRRLLGEGTRAPFWAAAWKFPPETARTVVRAIRWKVGRTGRRTPVAEVVPVSLGGVRISHVSLNGKQTLVRLDLAAGDGVVLALVGDVIPQVLAVEGRAERKAGPERAPEETAESGTAACLSDAPGCRERFLARAAHFTSKQGLNVAGLGPGRLRTLVEAGLVRDLPSLFRLETGEVATLDGFGQGSAQRLSRALRRVGRPEPARLLAALGIPGVGRAAARKLVKEFGSLDALLHSPKGQQEGSLSVRRVQEFFGSRQGRELLEGLGEAGLL